MCNRFYAFLKLYSKKYGLKFKFIIKDMYLISDGLYDNRASPILKSQCR